MSYPARVCPDGYYNGAQQFVVYLLLLVAGSDAGCIGYYPHLHETGSVAESFIARFRCRADMRARPIPIRYCRRNPGV